MERASVSSVVGVNVAAPASAPALNTRADNGLLLRIGAGCGVSGALLTFVANGLHPHPNEFQLESLLREVAASSTWSIIHLALIFGLILIFASLVALALTLDSRRSAVVGWFACAAVLVGGALILTSTAVDGFAMDDIARSWVAAGAGEKAAALHTAEAFYESQYAIYSLSVVVFIGMGIFLYGVATSLSDAYPKPVAWLAIVAGAGAFAVGVVQVLAGPTFRATELLFVVFSALATGWVLIMSLLMWRKARKLVITTS